MQNSRTPQSPFERFKMEAGRGGKPRRAPQPHPREAHRCRFAVACSVTLEMASSRREAAAEKNESRPRATHPRGFVGGGGSWLSLYLAPLKTRKMASAPRVGYGRVKLRGRGRSVFIAATAISKLFPYRRMPVSPHQGFFHPLPL